MQFLFKVGMHIFYVRLIAIRKIHETISILQHHCRCCGRTLCHEHSSNQMVRAPISFIYIFWLTMHFSSCKSLDKSALTKQSFVFFFLCAYSRLYRNLAYFRLLEFVQIVSITLQGKLLLIEYTYTYLNIMD